MLPKADLRKKTQLAHVKLLNKPFVHLLMEEKKSLKAPSSAFSPPTDDGGSS